jgi:hypothetical protein
MVNNFNAVIKRTITGIISFRSSKLEIIHGSGAPIQLEICYRGFLKKLKAYLQKFFPDMEKTKQFV